MKHTPLILALTFISSISQAKSITITMVGDMGFNKNNQGPMANYVEAYGQKTSWNELTSNIDGYINSDINFANLETVVTDQALPSPAEKKYKFQSHPNAVEHVIRNLGFNLFSLANNHAADFGGVGLESTYTWMNYFSQSYPIYHHGVGVINEITSPKIFNLKNTKIAFIAVGIDSFGLAHAPATQTSVGSLNYHNSSHTNQALKNLKSSKADLKIVSVHYGTEGSVVLDSGQQAKFRKLIDDGEADLVIGHHPHVVRPIEIYKGKLIIYSLGNFLLIGAANMDKNQLGASYGLIVKAKIDISKNNVSFRQILAIPIQGMHYKPSALSNEAGQARVQYLNQLSQSEVGKSAVLFSKYKNYGVWER
jgi:poly-gamma-glutamate capsule biosynthesis protein CapA/YwtB (metallophosphatase superfamily)